MERFLIKTPRQKTNRRQNIIEDDSKLKQATLQSLKRVVVTENLLESKRILLNPSKHSTEIICEHLRRLSTKLPSAEILKETRLGRVIKPLCKHSDEAIAQLAKTLVQLWTNDIRRRKSLTRLDVRCDGKTETLRQNARNLLIAALKTKTDSDNTSTDDCMKLAKFIERKVYFSQDQLTNLSYRKIIRTMVFSLKHSISDDTKRSWDKNFTAVETFLNAYL